MSRASLTASLLLALAGCAGEISPFDTSSQLELGTGDLEFQELADDGELEVVLGAQGGYHVVGNARIYGFAPADVLGANAEGVRFELTAYDGLPLNIDSGEIRIGLKPMPDGTYVCQPGHHVLVGEPAPEELDGTPALFSVEMTGMDGEILADARRVRLRFPGL